MIELINWVFSDLLVPFWSLITQYWILSIFVLITVLNWVVGLINRSQSD